MSISIRYDRLISEMWSLRTRLDHLGMPQCAVDEVELFGNMYLVILMPHPDDWPSDGVIGGIDPGSGSGEEATAQPMSPTMRRMEAVSEPEMDKAKKAIIGRIFGKLKDEPLPEPDISD